MTATVANIEGETPDTQDAERPKGAFARFWGGPGGKLLRVLFAVLPLAYLAKKLDLSLVLSRFIIADVYSRTGNAPGSTAKLYIDGIHWSK